MGASSWQWPRAMAVKVIIKILVEVSFSEVFGLWTGENMLFLASSAPGKRCVINTYVSSPIGQLLPPNGVGGATRISAAEWSERICHLYTLGMADVVRASKASWLSFLTPG